MLIVLGVVMVDILVKLCMCMLFVLVIGDGLFVLFDCMEGVWYVYVGDGGVWLCVDCF